jgi:DinB family protein
MWSSVTGMTALIDIDWTSSLAEQLDWQWQSHLRPRLQGLTDEEYFWEPVPGCWSIRERGATRSPRAAGGGQYLLEIDYSEPEIPPVTTIAWRLAHCIVGVFGMRNAAHFAGPPADWRSFEYAGTAAEALAQLDAAYACWIAGVRSLGPAGLARACGPAEEPYDESPLADLVLHINREALHHGAEIALLRDLYRWKGADVRGL